MAEYESNETEAALLGLFLINQKSINEVFGRLEEDDFSNVNNKIIFSNMKKMYESNEPIDLVNLVSVMKNNNDISKLPSPKYLSNLMGIAGLETLTFEYLKTLKNKSKLRQLKLFLNTQKNYLDNTSDDVKDIIENVEEEIFKVTRESVPTKEKNISDVVDEYISKLKNFDDAHSENSIYSDFLELDKLTHGFKPGDLVVVAARPSMGKTAFSLALATNAAYKKNVYYFSLEMPLEQITQRIVSSSALIDSRILKEPKKMQNRDWAKIQEIKPILEGLNLVIDDTPGIKLSELIWKIRNYSMSNKLDLVVIDYLQLITTKSGNFINRQQEVSDISRNLKTLARELNIPIIVLAQLNRGVEKREDKRPLMSDIRESGAVEQDADIIAFLYREGYYVADKNTSTQPVEIIISKNRNGSTGTCILNLHLSSGKFTS